MLAALSAIDLNCIMSLLWFVLDKSFSTKCASLNVLTITIDCDLFQIIFSCLAWNKLFLGSHLYSCTLIAVLSGEWTTTVESQRQQKNGEDKL